VQILFPLLFHRDLTAMYGSLGGHEMGGGEEKDNDEKKEGQRTASFVPLRGKVPVHIHSQHRRQ